MNDLMKCRCGSDAVSVEVDNEYLSGEIECLTCGNKVRAPSMDEAREMWNFLMIWGEKK